MAKRGDKPRRLMTKVRRQVGKPTMKITPKNIYNRNKWKRRMTREYLKGLVEEKAVLCCIRPPGDGSTCAGGTCACLDDYTCDRCRMGEEND